MTHCWLKTSGKAVQRAALLISFLLVFITSCKKEDNQIGVDFLPDDSNFRSIVVDTLSVVAYTVQEDTIKVDSLSTNLLGAINDPAFGMRTANLYTQVLLREINVDFGANPGIDSVILSLARNTGSSAYGNDASEIDFDIHKMDEIIDNNLSYYSNYKPQLGDKIGSWQGNLRSNDTAWFEEDGDLKWQINTFRIPLNNSFGEEFFANAGQYGSNEVFLNFLNGIALIPKTAGLASGDGAMVGIDKFSDNSKLIVYYNDGLRKEFEINSESQNLSTYTLAGLPSTITDQVSNPGTHYNTTYAQTLAGHKIKIDIPNLLSLVADGNAIAINEAKITFKVKDGSTSTAFPAPDRMLLLQPSEVDGSNAFILDLVDVLFPPSSAWIGNVNYGGNYDETTGTYTFRFNRHLQSVLDTYLNSGEDANRGFYLVIPSDNPITPSRLILDTDNNGVTKNLNLKITYTKL